MDFDRLSDETVEEIVKLHLRALRVLRGNLLGLISPSGGPRFSPTGLGHFQPGILGPAPPCHCGAGPQITGIAVMVENIARSDVLA